MSTTAAESAADTRFHFEADGLGQGLVKVGVTERDWIGCRPDVAVRMAAGCPGRWDR